MLARRTVVVVHRNTRLAGDVSDRADTPDFESVDIILADHVEALVRRRDLSAVSGQETAEQVKTEDVGLEERRAAEVLGVDGRLDRVHVPAEYASRDREGDIQALALCRRDRVVNGVVAVR